MRSLFAVALMACAATATVASADTLASRGWVRMASVSYPGGTTRLDIPFAAEVQTRQIAVETYQYCAPRALASRARVEDDAFPGAWPRLVPLRFVSQGTYGAVLRAFYVVDDGGDWLPLVTGLSFSLSQVVAGPARPCRMDFYALPGRN
jgi:hypothetical protein